MKIILVETSISGHRKIYHKTLVDVAGINNVVLITPEKEADIDCEQVIGKNINLGPRTLIEYIKWLKFIKHQAEKYDASVVHFLDGDILYRFCGLYLSTLKKYKTIATFHHVAEDLVHNLSIRLIAREITCVVIHTEKIYNRMCFLKNRILINYPYFINNGGMPSKEESREYYNIDNGKIVLLSLGGTRYDKGIDILLKALSYVSNKNVELLVAGKEEYFKKEDIEKFDTGEVKINLNLRTMCDYEWNMALKACDIVVLPYRKSFTGASGPLADAIWFKKPVIGKSDGSVGDMIKTYDLGWTFTAGDYKQLASMIDNACLNLSAHNGFIEFRRKITVEKFMSDYKNLYYS